MGRPYLDWLIGIGIQQGDGRTGLGQNLGDGERRGRLAIRRISSRRASL